MGLFDFLFSWMCKRVFKKVSTGDTCRAAALHLTLQAACTSRVLLICHACMQSPIMGALFVSGCCANHETLMQVDYNHNNVIEPLEVEVAILQLYNVRDEKFIYNI